MVKNIEEKKDKKYRGNYLYNIGDIVNGLEILGQTRSNKEDRKAYFTKCIKDGYENPKPISEMQLKKGDGCSVCRGLTVVKGINDLHTTANWMCEYIVNEEDWYTHTRNSHKKILAKCPFCRKEKSMAVKVLYQQGLGCSCGDGNSYPNKFVYALLNQLNVEYETEKSFEWSENRRYDVYISSLNCIIENHGEQHYEQSPRGRSLQEEQTNDLMKELLARGNGIRHYIDLDCRNSEIDWIKNSVMQSELPKILNFSENDIDWNKCEEFALSNLVKQVCDYRKETSKSIKEIAEEFKLSKVTIRNYLNKGVKLGWCEYNGEEEKAKMDRKNNCKISKKVEIFKDGVSLGVFESCAELERQSEKLFSKKLLNTHISDVANGKRKTHKGYTFKYI